MKKKVLLSLLIIVTLFTITGCGSNNKENSKGEKISSTNSQENENNTSSGVSSKLDKNDFVNKLHFKYSSSANIKDSTNGKRIEYENYNIIVSHQKDKTIAELENSRKFLLISTDSINKIEWKKYSYNDEQVSSVVYMYEKDDGTYVVTISHDARLNINLGNEIKEFMNEIKFE